MGSGRFWWTHTARSRARKSAIEQVLAPLPTRGSVTTRGACAGYVVEALTVLFLVDDVSAELAAQRKRRDQLRVKLARDPGKIGGHLPGTSVGAALLAEVEQLGRSVTGRTRQSDGLVAARNGLIREARQRSSALVAKLPKRKRSRHVLDPTPTISPTRQALLSHLSTLPANRREHWHELVVGALRRGASAPVNDLAPAILDLLWPQLSSVDAMLRQLAASERATHVLTCRLVRHRAAAGVTPAEMRWRESLASELRGIADRTMRPPAVDPISADFSISTTLFCATLRRRASKLT